MSHTPAFLKLVDAARARIREIQAAELPQALATGGRIEIRGFGSFSLHYRAPRLGRNPKTGEAVDLTGKYVPHFKPGKELRDRVNGEDDERHTPRAVVLRQPLRIARRPRVPEVPARRIVGRGSLLRLEVDVDVDGGERR